ncbi:hypothetical protein ABZ805_21560 [Saccharopolyspora sp. NPDC047091]|uniref:baeRF2 domain-containing protein n=1 Tax=Saccharopolyspora sp. NPDC047091 TaxID=3155924 RepID=UPI0033E3EDF5
MKLAFLQDVYGYQGPFATVYLDTSADAEDAAKAVQLRWRSARERLADAGADEATLRALDETVDRHEYRIGHRGQVLVATAGEVVFGEELPQPPDDASDDEKVHFGTLPHLLPYLRLRASRIPHVVALVDHVDAELTVVAAGAEPRTRRVQGGDHPVHKAPAGADELNEQRFQNKVEEQWLRNAKDAAEEIGKQAMRIGAELVVLAGDPQQRKLVHDNLPGGVRERTAQTDAGHLDQGDSAEGLRGEVAETVDAAVSAHVDEAVREFEQQRGRDERAAEGWTAVLAALQRGQVRTVLWGSPESVSWLHVGPVPNQVALHERELTDMGVSSPGSAPASAAVVWSAAGTDADLVLVDPDEVKLTDGIGAVLRYTDA